MRTVGALALGAILLAPAAASARSEDGKPIVAIAEFTNSTGRPIDVGRGLQDKMARALEDTGKVVVVERYRLDKVIAEQRLGLTGLVEPSTAAQVGHLLGADYMLMGNLDQFSYDEVSIPIGSIIGGITGHYEADGVGSRSFTISVGVTVTIVDANTSETTRGAGSATRKGGGLGFDVTGSRGIGWDELNKGIVGEAIHEAIDRAVHSVIRRVFIPRVIKRSGDEVFIDQGINDRVREGDRYRVLAEESLPGGHVITDEIGVIEVVRVWETASKCRILEGSDRISPGQQVGFIRPPAPPEETRRPRRRRDS